MVLRSSCAEKYNDKKGPPVSVAFTLVELLVAMAIIAGLIALSLFVVQTAQRTGRDDERRLAMSEMDDAIRIYYRSKARYPALDTNFVWQSQTEVSIGDRQVSLSGAAERSPADVTDAAQTYYTYTLSEDGYKLCALMESGAWYKIGNSQSNCP